MKDNASVSTVDFSTDENGDLVKHTQTVSDVYEKLDPFGLDAEVSNLKMAQSDIQGVIDKKTAEIASLQAQIDAKVATKQQIMAEVPDLAGKMTSAASQQVTP